MGHVTAISVKEPIISVGEGTILGLEMIRLLSPRDFPVIPSSWFQQQNKLQVPIFDQRRSV